MPDRFTWTLGVICVGLFLLVSFWLSPGSLVEPLSTPEIDSYLERIDGQLALPAAEANELLARLRGWAEADDGAPAFMLNLMRYRQQLAAVNPADGGDTPQALNERYEAAVRPIILRHGGYPILGGSVPGESLLSLPGLERWDRVAVVRYPNRRAFLDMISDSDYAGLESMKTSAMEVLLVPFSAAVVLPDLRWPAGVVLLAVFLITGWWRSGRRASPRTAMEGLA
ncbi:MAG: hypothetical protein AB7I04_10055 [Pseudomonadales bacterium]